MIKLEQNYRSTQTILDAANAVIANNRGQMAKHLWTDVGEGDQIKVRELERRARRGAVRRRRDRAPRRRGRLARRDRRLLPDQRAVARARGHARAREIGYQVIGGTKFYERAEIKDAVAYLKLLVNPQDGCAFPRIANSPKRGIGQTTLQPRRSPTRTRWASTPWDVARGAGGRARRWARAAHKAVGRFMSIMERLRERAEDDTPIGDLLAGDCCARPATSMRSRQSGRSRRRAGSRTSRSSSASARECDASGPTTRSAASTAFLAADRAARRRRRRPPTRASSR